MNIRFGYYFQSERNAQKTPIEIHLDPFKSFGGETTPMVACAADAENSVTHRVLISSSKSKIF